MVSKWLLVHIFFEFNQKNVKQKTDYQPLKQKPIFFLCLTKFFCVQCWEIKKDWMKFIHWSEWTTRTVKGTHIWELCFTIFMNDCTNKLTNEEKSKNKKQKPIFSLLKLNEKFFLPFFFRFENLKFREMEKKKCDYFMM